MANIKCKEYHQQNAMKIAMTNAVKQVCAYQKYGPVIVAIENK